MTDITILSSWIIPEFLIVTSPLLEEFSRVARLPALYNNNSYYYEISNRKHEPIGNPKRGSSGGQSKSRITLELNQGRLLPYPLQFIIHCREPVLLYRVGVTESTQLRRLVAGFPLGQVFSEYFGFPCFSFIPPIAPQSALSSIQGQYKMAINGRSSSPTQLIDKIMLKTPFSKLYAATWHWAVTES
jgi:hypothetical protein